MPTTPRHEGMILVSSLNITPEGSLVDLLTAVGPTVEDGERKKQLPEKKQHEAPSELVNVGIPDTHLKSISERDTREAPCRIETTREASREMALVTMRQFFATVEESNGQDSTGRPIGVSSESGGREDLNVPGTSASVVTTIPAVPDVDPIDTSSPRVILPSGSPSCPTATATCRPRTWMQQITEGQINESVSENNILDESNLPTIDVVPEEIPNELGCEQRVLHPFELLGVRFPTDSTPPNQRRLAENDTLVELIRMTEYL